MEVRIPIHIIGGFLGVGKTTAILSVLKRLGNQERLAILVNERGEVGLDGAILESETPGLALREVTGGCICCTAGPALGSSLREILDKVDPERILIEPSGIGKPGDIADLIDSMNMGQLVHVKPIVTLVDPAYFLEPHMMELPVYRDQVEAADILVANRCDLAEEETRKAFYRKAQKLFPPKGFVLTTAFGYLPQKVLSWEPDVHPRIETGTRTGGDLPLTHGSSTGGSKGIGFREKGWIWPPETRFDHRRLQRTLETIPGPCGISEGHTVRVKGIFRTDRGWHLMEVALEDLSERITQYRRDSRCQVILAEETEERIKEIGKRLEGCILKSPGV
jgi:G3E family GTPase